MKAIYFHITEKDHQFIKVEAAKRNLTIKDFILSCVERTICKEEKAKSTRKAHQG